MPKIIEAEIRMGNAWMLNSDHAQALEWPERAYKHALENQDTRGICDALCEIGISHWRLGHFDASAQYLQQGLELARQLNDKSKQAYARTILGTIKADSGNFEESHEIFEEGLKLAREINDKRRIAGILNNYSNTHYREGNYEASRRLVEECLSVVLQAAYGEYLAAHRDQPRQREFEPEREQQEHDAELGERLGRLRRLDPAERVRPDDHAD